MAQVGSQSLLGIPMLNKLRKTYSDIKIWPFEDISTAKIVFCETYYGIHDIDAQVKDAQRANKDAIKDALQVEIALNSFAKADKNGQMARYLFHPNQVPVPLSVKQEEGWILGILPEG